MGVESWFVGWLAWLGWHGKRQQCAYLIIFPLFIFLALVVVALRLRAVGVLVFLFWHFTASYHANFFYKICGFNKREKEREIQQSQQSKKDTINYSEKKNNKLVQQVQLFLCTVGAVKIDM